MAKNQSMFFPQEGAFTGVTVVASVLTPAATAGAEGAKLMAVNIAQVSTGLIFIQLGADLIIQKTAGVAAGTNLLTLTDFPVDVNGNKYMNIPAGTVVNVQHNGAPLDFTVYLENY